MNKAMLLSVIVCALACGAVFAEDAKTKPVEFGKTSKHTMNLPETWKATVPESGMRSLEVVVPKTGDDKEDAEITIFNFARGGGYAGNLTRWKSAFAGVEPKERKLKTGAGIDVDVAELEGAYKGMGKDGPMAEAKEGYKMIGAVIVTAADGEFYIKLIGPKATVDANKAAFDKAIESFK